MDESEVTTEELRELIRFGHGMLKDLKQAQRETRTLMAELDAKAAEFRDVPKLVVREAMQPVIDSAMKQIADDVADTTTEVTQFVEKAIYDRFDTLMGIILGDGGTGVSIPQALVQRRHSPAIDLSKLTDQDIFGLNGPIERKKK